MYASFHETTLPEKAETIVESSGYFLQEQGNEFAENTNPLGLLAP